MQAEPVRGRGQELGELGVAARLLRLRGHHRYLELRTLAWRRAFAEDLDGHPVARFSQKSFSLSFGMKNGLILNMESVTSISYELISRPVGLLSGVRNIQPKVKPYFKLKCKLKFFQLNHVPELARFGARRNVMLVWHRIPLGRRVEGGRRGQHEQGGRVRSQRLGVIRARS